MPVDKRVGDMIALELGTELRAALRPLRSVLWPVVLVSAALNMLMLSGSFFMLLVYDEVLPSRSVPTLVGLLVMVSVAYAFLAALDFIRLRIMGHVAAIAAGRISTRVIDLLARYELTAGPLPNGTQPLRDLDQIRSFLAGPGPIAFLDLPWLLLFLGVLFVLHWSLGLLTLAGVAVLVALMLLTDRLTGPRVRELSDTSSNRYAMADAVRRNSEALLAMGMMPGQQRSWAQLERDNLAQNDRLTRLSGSMTSGTKAFRMLLQSVVLALGAYLVIHGYATGGIIIASSILSARALAPVEQAIANWKGATAASLALKRLGAMLDQVPGREAPLALPLPAQTLDVRGLTTGPPGARRITLGDINFSLSAGDAMAIIGRSGSGKSTLVRALCGVWPALRGTVRLDGATLDQWSAEDLGRAIGYIPQNCEMLPGTIAQNIARFDSEAATDDILAAARAADIHDFILHLEGGYEHVLGPGGGMLSAGQIQRIALARALFRNPFLIVMDEPNSNLDANGEIALGHAIRGARERGAIVLVVAHRPSILNFMSHVLIMNGGQVEQFGRTEDVQLGTRKIPERSQKA